MNILEAQELRRGKKSVRPFSLPPVGAAPLTAPAGPATAPAAASAPVIPSAPKQRGFVGEVLHDVGQTARAVGTGLYSAVADVLPGQVAKTIIGNVALGEGGRAQQYAAKQAEDLKRWEMSPEDRENKLFGIVKAGTVQQGLQQLGNSIAPMIAGIGAGALAGSAGAGPIGTIAGAAVGAGALTAPMAYRASKADYVLQMRDAFKQARPNGTEEEWQKFKASIENNAKLYGLWEAGPEIVGNMVTAGLLKTPAGSIIKAIPLIESGATRLLASGVAKLALDMPVEVLTESVTGYNQAKIEYASGLRAEPPTPAGAFVEAAPQTIIMTLATMGLGSVANSLMTDNSGQVQRHKIIRLLNKSGVGRETINDLLDAKDWNSFNASMKKHEAEISKVGAELAEATAGTPAAAVDPNAPKVNPILNPEAAPSVFDVPVGAQPAQDATAVNPLLAQNQPTTNAEDEATVRRALDARGPAYAGIRAVEPAPSAGVAAVKEISDKLGLRVIWIDGAPVGGRAIQGAAPAGENTIFLHTDLLTNPKRDPVMMVYAHELTHRSERASPKEYGILRDSVLARAEARASVEEKVASGMSRAAAESEAVAEQVEVLGTDQAFWQEVFAGKDQSFIEHIIQIVTDMAQRVFGTNQAAKAEAIRGAAVAAFQALQAQSQGQNQNQNQNQTLITQEAANGVQEGQAQEVAQPLQATATAEAAITGTPDIKAPPEAKAASAPEATRAAEPPRPAEPVKAEGVDSDGYVLDKKGKRATVLHGSHKATVAFEDGKTAFFTDNDFVAKGYTWTRGIGRRPSAEGSVTKAQLVMKKPLVIDANGKRNDNIPVPWKEWKPKVFGNLPPDAVSVEDAAEYAKQNGYDGVIIRNVIDSADVDDRTKSTVYAVFSPSQIKTGEGEAPRAAEPQAAPRAVEPRREIDALQSRIDQAPTMEAKQAVLDAWKADPRNAAVAMGLDYGVEIRVGEHDVGGEATGGMATVGADTTPVRPFAANWTRNDAPDFQTSREYPQNQATAAHEIVHTLFSRNPQTAHAALESLIAQGVPRDQAFESLVDLGGLYLLEPRAITDAAQRRIIGDWLDAHIRTALDQAPLTLRPDGRLVGLESSPPKPAEAAPRAAQEPAPPKQTLAEVAKLRREAEAAKAERAKLRAEKRQREIEQNKRSKTSGLTRRQAATARRIYDYDRGDAPVLSMIIEQFGGIRKEDVAKYEIETSLIPKSIRSKLFPAKGKGSDWNSILWAIENDNLIPGALRPDEVGFVLSREISSLQRRLKDERDQAREYRQRSADERGFKRAIIRNDKNAKVRREAIDLREGDVLVRNIEGIPVEFTVAEVEDTTGNIVINSTLYGPQPVEYFEMVHADKLIRSEEAVDGAEDVPFSTKDATEDEGETLADTASSIEDDAERDAFARAELEKRAGVPLVQGPKNLAALSQNHVVATAKDLLERLAEGEIDAVEAMEALEAVEKRVGRTVARAESKAAKEAKMAGESRQQGLPGMEGLAKSPYGTPDDGANGTLFSAKKLTQEDLEDNGEGRTREYSISRFFRETLKREWSASYKQKSAQQAIGELEAITEKHGEDWVMDHLFDLSKETQAEFPMALRPLAARHIIESADKAFRAWGVNDDGSNLPGNPAIDKLWLKIEDLRNKAAAYEREGGRGMAWLRSTYEANNINSPLGVRKTVNKLHDKLAAPVIGPVKAPIIEKALNEAKTAYDEAIAALEEERKRNSELEESLRVLDEALGKRISQNEARIKQRAAKSEAYRRGIDEDLAATMEELKAAGMSLEGLSSKPTIEMIQKAVKLYIGIHGADQAKVAEFLNRNLGEKLAPATVKALINDAQLALDNAGRAAEKAAPRKQPAATRKGATVISRAPDMTLQGPTSGHQLLFDSGKMWGEGRVLNIGEADAKRIALELTEAGQTIMRGISSNVEVVISNALRHGRNAAGIEKVLVDSGIDRGTARRMVKKIVKRRAELVRPALETLRKKYAAKGDKVSRTIASAMDKIMSAMELADRASISQVSGFFDGNAWDESRRIIEEAFGFKSEITRDWFNETMRLYREYEKADEAGNHLLSSVLHSEMLHRVARVQNGTGASLAVRSYIQGGMLWGPQTHWWNLFNTASRNIDAANAASIEQIIKAVRAEKGKKLEYLKAAFAPWAIMGMSHKQAWGVAKYIMKTGVNPLSMRIGDEAKFGTDPKVASAPEWHPFYKKLAMRPFKYVGRALIAADSYFRTNIENTDIYLQAYNAAISRGEPAPMAAKQALGMIGFVTDGTNEAYNEAARKADENGLKGADRDMNIRIELMNKLDPEMRDHAQKQGAAETFNDQNPEGLAGWIADHLRHHSSDPIIFYLGMFARIGANVFNYGLQTNPITGFLSLAKDSTIGRYKAGKTNVKLTSEERVRRTIRATQGLAVTGTVLAMALSAAKDYDEDEDKDKKLRFGVSAVGPRDLAARKLWRQQHKPFMLTINGKEISYKWIAPLATPLALAGAIMDEIRFGSLKDAETDEAREESFLSALLPTMIMGLMSITTDELPGQGMVKFADMIYSGGEGGAQSAKAWNRFFQQQAASLGTALIPYSALVRYLDRVYDPTVYTPNSIDGLKMYPYAFLRNMPYFRKAALYPMRNIFGDPIQTPDRGSELGVGERATRLMFDRFLNNMVEDPDIQFLTKVQRGFNAPSRKETRIVTNENGLYGLRNLTDAEYDRFLEIFGKELRTQIVTIRKDYSSSDEIEKWATPQNKALRKRLEDARSTAMNWAMYKYLVETKNQLKVVKGKE